MLDRVFVVQRVKKLACGFGVGEIDAVFSVVCKDL